MFEFNHRTSRQVTSAILEGVENGLYDKDALIYNLLNWMSENEVAEFARRNDYLPDTEDETDSED